MTDKTLLTPAQLAVYWGISPSASAKRAERMGIPFRRMAMDKRRKVYRLADVEKAEARTVAA